MIQIRFAGTFIHIEIFDDEKSTVSIILYNGSQVVDIKEKQDSICIALLWAINRLLELYPNLELKNYDYGEYRNYS